MFWSEERVDAWYNAIFPSGTEVVNNLMCLAPSVHKYHERAYFVLEPRELSDDKRRLRVRFFWLPKHGNSNRVNLSSTPLTSEG